MFKHLSLWKDNLALTDLNFYAGSTMLPATGLTRRYVIMIIPLIIMKNLTVISEQMKEKLSEQNLFDQLISSQLITNKNIWFILKEDKIGLTLKIDKLNKLKKQMHMSNNKVLLLFFDIITIFMNIIKYLRIQNHKIY